MPIVSYHIVQSPSIRIDDIFDNINIISHLFTISFNSPVVLSSSNQPVFSISDIDICEGLPINSDNSFILDIGIPIFLLQLSHSIITA